MAIQSDIKAADNWFTDEDKTLRFTVTDKATGLPQDITGWAIAWAMAHNEGGDPLLTKAVGTGVSLTAPATGVLQVAIADTDTVDLAEGFYLYRLRRTDDGNEELLAWGNAYLHALPD